MKTIRRILFDQPSLALAFTFLTILSQLNFASASVTKVGNGDDGADLESLTLITRGPIWEARAKAVEKVKQLNVMGVPGLGLLIPELERSDLLMVAQDAHPTGESAGSLEISADSSLVYARTFAEPYAATRFFPAALKLSRDQLVALHIHEALHRSLPADIRYDENIVMHLTLAITSPGASFDRVTQVAGRYVKPSSTAQIARYPSQAVGAAATSSLHQDMVLPPRSRTQLSYQFDSYYADDAAQALHTLDVKTSLLGYRKVAGVAIEPNLRGRIKNSNGQFARSIIGGPSSFDLSGRIKANENEFYEPFIRFTASSLDTQSLLVGDRDILTMGFSYSSDASRSASEVTFLYSLPSTAYHWREETHYKTVMSLVGRSAYKLGRFRLGGVAELHASQGKDEIFADPDFSYGSSDSARPFRLLVVGPELGFYGRRFHWRAYGKMILNSSMYSLSDLGDVVDRGSGRQTIGTSFGMQF